MNEILKSPRAVWETYARDGKFAYQWSPDAARAVWHPRLTCPFGGRAPLEWRLSAGQDDARGF
ncbi:hypothetical protein [Marivita sp.]|jgi:hypothetical protein|uniref:hypothetical protein n=1 Tax=Marivita sp. TaxID=2003365 RepID=UPI003F6FCE10